MTRHTCTPSSSRQSKLHGSPKKLTTRADTQWRTGAADVCISGAIPHANTTGKSVSESCSAESPKGRRSICYDHEALESRKENKPKNSAIGMADDMGIEILTEEEYRQLQKFGKFDTKTSSWIKTPSDIRKLGGAIFADYRY